MTSPSCLIRGKTQAKTISLLLRTPFELQVFFVDSGPCTFPIGLEVSLPFVATRRNPLNPRLLSPDCPANVTRNEPKSNQMLYSCLVYIGIMLLLVRNVNIVCKEQNQLANLKVKLSQINN